VVCNQVYLEMYGYAPSEVKPGMSIRELIALRQARGLHGDTDAQDSARDWIADPNADLTISKRFSDGRIISVRRRMREGGGYVVTHEDITERHRLEQNEQEARELLTAVFDAAPAAIICLDPGGRVMAWSRGAERLFGYAAAEVIGGPYPLVPEGKQEEFKQLFQRALGGETFRDVHVQRRSKDGRLVEVNFASAAMLDHDGGVRGIAYALNDITESEKLRKRFTEQHEQLDVSQQKSTIANGTFQVALDAFCADSDDAKPLLVTYLSKERSPRNMARNKSPEIDALYDKFNAALSEADQKKLAGDLQRAIITETNSVPVIWYSRIVAHVPQLKGWKILPTHFANQDLTDVWLDQ